MHNHTKRTSGFTLIETISVVVLVGAVSAALVTLFGNLYRGQDLNAALADNTLLVQQCAEKIMADRRSGTGYDAVSSTSCSGIASVDVTVQTPGQSGTSCPANTSGCKLLTISQGGVSLRLMLVASSLD